jgi:ABC-2 type transport system ATP-binding protein
MIRFRLPASAPVPEAVQSAARVDGDRIEIETKDPTKTLYELTNWAITSGVSLDALEVSRPSLEDVYLEITKEAETA